MRRGKAWDVQVCCRLFAAAEAGLEERVWGLGDLLIGAAWPRRLWSGRLQRDGDCAEELGLWAGGGEGQTDARDRLDDASAELEKAQAQGGELGRGQGVDFRDGVAHGEHQPVSGGVEHETDLIGDR